MVFYRRNRIDGSFDFFTISQCICPHGLLPPDWAGDDEPGVFREKG
jgi:hypothetical protein